MIESLGGVTPTWWRDPNLVVCLMALPQMLQFCLAARRFHGEREFLKRMGFLPLQRRSRVEKKKHLHIIQRGSSLSVSPVLGI